MPLKKVLPTPALQSVGKYIQEEITDYRIMQISPPQPSLMIL